ncbi:hypothetical protein Tco_0771871, partial [Tanacetum coccineum]
SWFFLSSRFHQTRQRRAWGRLLLELFCSARFLLPSHPLHLLLIHDDTPLIPTDTPTISPIVPTIPPISPAIQYTSPFICIDSSDSDTPNTPPSQDPYEVTVARGGAE